MTFLKGFVFGAVLIAYIALGIRVFTVDPPSRPVQHLHDSTTVLPPLKVA